MAKTTTKGFVPEKKVFRRYPFPAAGRVWTIPEVTFLVAPDKTLGLAPSEVLRVHRAIANEIIGSTEDLTPDELEYLADLTEATYADLAKAIGVARSNLTNWRNKDIPRPYGQLLKRWFWVQLFGEDLAKNGGELRMTADVVRDDTGLLAVMHDEAIKRKLAFPLKRAS